MSPEEARIQARIHAVLDRLEATLVMQREVMREMNERMRCMNERLDGLEPQDPGDEDDTAANADDGWGDFVDAHPELVAREPLTFTDDELLGALRLAMDDWQLHCQKMRERFGHLNPRHYSGDVVGVHSDSVALRLTGLPAVVSEGPSPPQELRPTNRDVIRVGMALARLTKAGSVRRVNPSWASNRWVPMVEGGAS